MSEKPKGMQQIITFVPIEDKRKLSALLALQGDNCSNWLRTKIGEFVASSSLAGAKTSAGPSTRKKAAK